MSDGISDGLSGFPGVSSGERVTLAHMARKTFNELDLDELASVAMRYHLTPIRVDYTNHRGETATRTITPLRVRWGKTEHHPVEQWLLDCFDHDRDATRTYALDDCDFVRST